MIKIVQRLLPVLLLVLIVLVGCDATTVIPDDPEERRAPDTTGGRGGPNEPEPEPEPQPLSLTAEPAPKWTSLFDRTSGWVGGDGIYSIPLSGQDVIGGSLRARTLLLFSDTIIGEVIDEKLQTGARIINNSVALLEDAAPNSELVQFYWKTDEQGRPQAIFVPRTPSAEPEDWYWLGDGFVNLSAGGATYVFAYRMHREGSGGLNFATAEVTLLKLPRGSEPPFENHRQIETPLFVPANEAHGKIIFGSGVMVNTRQAGAPHPDGYVYIYGIMGNDKNLVAARVTPRAIENFDAWRFWNGDTWTPNINDVAPITSRLSNELSVTPLQGGRCLLVFQLDTWSPHVAVRVGESPVGPFGAILRVWSAPEPAMDDDVFVYNAKAHPHLSRPGTLLISYNVNTFDFFGDFAELADIYRPRFIRLDLYE